jgi:hypothetical protein
MKSQRRNADGRKAKRCFGTHCHDCCQAGGVAPLELCLSRWQLPVCIMQQLPQPALGIFSSSRVSVGGSDRHERPDRRSAKSLTEQQSRCFSVSIDNDLNRARQGAISYEAQHMQQQQTSSAILKWGSNDPDVHEVRTWHRAAPGRGRPHAAEAWARFPLQGRAVAPLAAGGP